MIDQQTFRQYAKEFKELCTQYPVPPPVGTPEHLVYTDWFVNKSMLMMDYVRTHPKFNIEQHSNKYFLTLTYDPRTPRDTFKDACIKQLQRDIHKHVSYVFEHEESNIHCHALVESKEGVSLTADRYKSHARKHGHVHVQHIKNDNGVQEYMDKENKPIVLK